MKKHLNLFYYHVIPANKKYGSVKSARAFKTRLIQNRMPCALLNRNSYYMYTQMFQEMKTGVDQRFTTYKF